MKTILLIQPLNYKPSILESLFYSAPASIKILKEITPPDYSVRVIRTTSSSNLPIKNISIVGITTLTMTANLAYRISEKYSKLGIPVILGGIHVSALPNEAKKFCASVVVGEVESVWKKVLQDYKTNSLNKIYFGKKCNNLSVPKIDNKLLEIASIQTSRGCPHSCDFCSVSVINGLRIRHASIQKIIENLKNINGMFKKYFIFTDDNIISNRKYAINLFKELKKLNKRWIAQAPIELGDDEYLLNLAYNAGLRLVFIGLENLDESSSFSCSKKVNIKKYKRCIKNIREKGILIFGCFIYGLDNTKINSYFNDLSSFLEITKLPFIRVSPLIRYPGSKIFDEKNKYYLNKRYKGIYNQFTEGELQKINYFENDFYSLSSIYLRSKNQPSFKYKIYFWILSILFRTHVRSSTLLRGKYYES